MPSLFHRPWKFKLLAVMLACIVANGGGCSKSKAPALGQVSGVVTLNGKPVEGANVMFIPTNARMANGKTDKTGKYDLSFNGSDKGATLGTHQVKITKRASAAEMEQVPPKYNDQTTLSAEVKAGKNSIDFPLTSE